MSESNEEPKPKRVIRRFVVRSLRQLERSERVPGYVTTAKDILNQTKLTEVASYWSGIPANREYYDEHELM